MADEERPVPPEETTTPPHGDPLAPGPAPADQPPETPGVPRTEEPVEPGETEPAD
jgi:hypothetical protein